MTTSTEAVEQALGCVFIAIAEVLPPAHQRIIRNILDSAVREDVVEGKAREIVERLLGRSPRQRRSSRRTARARGTARK